MSPFLHRFTKSRIRLQIAALQALALGVLLFCGQALAEESASGRRFMIATSSPEATRAGYEVLQKGGSAADAAIAAELVLGLVSPHSAGLGGGAAALYFEAATGRVVAFDARESAPSQAGKYLFTGPDGRPLSWDQASVGGRAVGVPGVPALLGVLHEAGGKLAWADLFAPALALAENGFAISPALAAAIAGNSRAIARYPVTRQYFLTAFGNPRAAGDTLVNPLYASTLRTLMEQGAQAFYHGKIASEVAGAVQDKAFDNPGMLATEDVESYAARPSEALCAPYRGRVVCAPDAPSAGPTLLETLGILKTFNLARSGPQNAGARHLILEAGRLACEDREMRLADPPYMEGSAKDLIAEENTGKRAGAIDPDKAGGGEGAGSRQTDPADTQGGAAQIVAVDQAGNALAMTAGLGAPFGSFVMVDGFLLNAALTGFAFEPERPDGTPAPNRAAGGERPLSLAAPVMVFDPAKGLVFAAAGGDDSLSAAMMAQLVVSMLDWNLGLRSAAALPKALATPEGPVYVEERSGTLPRALEKMGHKVVGGDFDAPLAAVARKTGGAIEGVSSAEGAVQGE